MGIVERTGRGVRLIYSGQIRTGHLPPDYSRTSEISVSLRLPGGKADVGFVTVVLSEEKRLSREFGVDELLLLNMLWHQREFTPNDAANIIQKSEGEARQLLEHLTDDGLVEKIKGYRRHEYMLSASMYRKIGKPEAYVRRRGIDRVRMRAMIVEYVGAYGKITRRDTAKMCQINASQAGWLLRKMTEDGLLKIEGLGGVGSYYVLASNQINSLPNKKQDNINLGDLQNQAEEHQVDEDISGQLELNLYPSK